MKDPADSVMLDTRLAGQVIRYHAWPTIRNQTVAEHTWQLLRILFSISATDIDEEIVSYTIFHDIGEIKCGDIPWPIKKENPVLKEEMDKIESAALNSQIDYWDIRKPPSKLSEYELKLFKWIELIEMAEFGLDEFCLGNSHGYIVAERCLSTLFVQIPQATTQTEVKLVYYVAKRLSLFSSQHTDGSVKKRWWEPQEWRIKGERPIKEASGWTTL